MYVLILVYPLIGVVCSGILGFFFGKDNSIRLIIFFMFLTWIWSLIIFYEVCLAKSLTISSLFSWVILDMHKITFGFLFDSLSGLMCVVVCTISFLVHLYSLGYMSHDPYLVRFMCYLSLFTFSMLLVVISDNFLQMFLGWEGVGVCSYLLINFWFTRIAANKAALKAMIMNRIADVFFILATVLIFLHFKTTDYLLVFSLITFMFDDLASILWLPNISIISLISFFLFIGAIGKSAQLGFHTWLPDAMEGPTPVSALLHAATMVTAGVFLVIRCSFFFEYSENLLHMLVIIGGLTSVFAGLIAIFAYDIKKVIAYSTTSQLGYMFLTCGLSNYALAFFHLFNHAFFKALLFLSAGVVIHALLNEQDMRRMGGLSFALPITFCCFIIGSLAIMGFPFLAGFYSKDLILELAFGRYLSDSLFVYSLALISAICTAVYSIRLLYMTFLNTPTMYFRYMIEISQAKTEGSFFMLFPLYCLSVLSVFSGYLFSELLVGVGTTYWQSSIFVLPSHLIVLDFDFYQPFIKNLPVIVSLFAAAVSYSYFFLLSDLSTSKFLNERLYFLFLPFSHYFGQAAQVNFLYNNIFISIYSFSYLINKYIDKGFFEYFTAYGFYKVFASAYIFFRTVWPSLLCIYIFFMLVHLIFFFLFGFMYFHLNLFILSSSAEFVLVAIFMAFNTD